MGILKGVGIQVPYMHKLYSGSMVEENEIKSSTGTKLSYPC